MFFNLLFFCFVFFRYLNVFFSFFLGSFWIMFIEVIFLSIFKMFSDVLLIIFFLLFIMFRFCFVFFFVVLKCFWYVSLIFFFSRRKYLIFGCLLNLVWSWSKVVLNFSYFFWLCKGYSWFIIVYIMLNIFVICGFIFVDVNCWGDGNSCFFGIFFWILRLVFLGWFVWLLVNVMFLIVIIYEFWMFILFVIVLVVILVFLLIVFCFFGFLVV